MGNIRNYATQDMINLIISQINTDKQLKTAAEWASSPILPSGAFGYDTTNNILKIGDGVTDWVNLPAFTRKYTLPFAATNIATIRQLAETNTAHLYFNVGDVITINITGEGNIPFVILGFNHDNLADGGGKAGITLGMQGLLSDTYAMSTETLSDFSWNESTIRTEILPEIMSNMPEEWQSMIKTVNKLTNGGARNDGAIQTTQDKLFLLSAAEICSTIYNYRGAVYTDPYISEGAPYEYWLTVNNGAVASNRIKSRLNQSSPRSWWLRTPNTASTIPNTYYIDTGGDMSYESPSNTNNISFCFCI